MGARHPASLLLFGALLLAAGPRPVRAQNRVSGNGSGSRTTVAEATGLVPLTLIVNDESGRPLPARASVTGSDGRACPNGADATLLSHAPRGGCFYVNGAATVSVPRGATTIAVAHGFEYTPVRQVVEVAGDTTVNVTLTRLVDLPAQGWFGGDLHAHARHLPYDYSLSPAQARDVARAEDLSILELLDEDWQFSGAPHQVSDANTILYFSYEHRNQTGGHVGLPGLRSGVSTGCCLDPQPPWPMLVDLAAQVHEQDGARVVLAHPHTTDDYDLLSTWPGAGLARELPVLEALGGLDAVDLVSYSNDPEVDTADWYALLSAGSRTPPSAGTDAALNWYQSGPPGGWRVYAHPGVGALDHDRWLRAFAAGRCFVTSFPLVPTFSVAGCEPGGTLEVAGDSLVATVSLEALCAIGLSGVTVVADGVDVWTRPFAAASASCSFDTSFVLRLARPGWLLLRVDGTAGHPATAAAAAVAYTNAVRILHDGAPACRPEAMSHWLDSLDRYEDLVLSRPAWSPTWQRDTVLARIERARRHFGVSFASRPDDFALQSPLPGDTAWAGLRWAAAADPDPGDQVRYLVRIGSDSTLADARVVRTAATSLSDLGLLVGHWYWWSVEAEDRAGDVTRATPRSGWFFLPGVLDVAADPVAPPPQAWPNPSRGPVELRGLGADVVVYDLAGRRIAWTGAGIRSSAGTVRWDGLDAGRPVAPGIYLARGADPRRSLRLIRLR
jgi:hypothetical protein